MKKIALAALLGLSFAAQAAHYDIKMLNSNSEGSMVFEPGYLKVQPGDTVTFQKIKATLYTAKRFLKVHKNSNLKKIRNSRSL